MDRKLNITRVAAKEDAKLKPCPFCGGRALLQDNGFSINGKVVHEPDYWWVECENCLDYTLGSKSKDGAIEKWNKPVNYW